MNDVGVANPVLVRRFALSAGLILGLTGIAKLWSAFGSARLLAVADPIVGISFKQLMLAVGVAELAIAVACLYSKTHRLASVLVVCMATSCAVYRFGLVWVGWHRPCSCMGALTDALHISPQAADNIMKAALAYLLIGSYGLLFWEWRKARLRRTEGGDSVQAVGRSAGTVW